MRTFLVCLAISTLCSLSAAAPQWPIYPQLVKPVIAAYKSDDYECHIEPVPINNMECRPKHDIICVDQDKTAEKISYKKVCQPIKSVVCGDDRPVGVGQRVPVSADASTASGAANAASASPYGRCHELTHEYCYLVPTVESEDRATPVCHVATTAQCEQVTLITHRQVCKEKEAQQGDDEGDDGKNEQQQGNYVEENGADAANAYIRLFPTFG